MLPVIILLVVLGLIIFFVVGIYNGLVTLRNRYKNAFAQIDVQLQRRYDLIPNLVETAKGYMKHEKETLEAVISARNQALGASKKAASDPSDGGAVKNLGMAESMLTQAMGKLMVVVEQYPELKADKSMSQLMEELSSTENRIAFSRQAFNDAVMEYNTSREKVPNNFIAGPFGFREAQLLEIETPEARVAPKVSF
ncbi:MAG: LemA family protein [Myxococcales bacterium]|nr:LemA family protein [Myxococcales bacterium]